MEHIITGELDYVQGYLRYGHFELCLSDEDFKKFKSLPEREQKEWLSDGELIIDSYSVDDRGEITDIYYT